MQGGSCQGRAPPERGTTEPGGSPTPLPCSTRSHQRPSEGSRATRDESDTTSLEDLRILLQGTRRSAETPSQIAQLFIGFGMRRPHASPSESARNRGDARPCVVFPLRREPMTLRWSRPHAHAGQRPSFRSPSVSNGSWPEATSSQS
jgi:hypothetical protein